VNRQQRSAAHARRNQRDIEMDGCAKAMRCNFLVSKEQYS